MRKKITICNVCKQEMGNGYFLKRPRFYGRFWSYGGIDEASWVVKRQDICNTCIKAIGVAAGSNLDDTPST